MAVPAAFKIVSGGQTGADRAALDVASELGIACGGWCPGDRSAEDGRIDERYPLTPAPRGGNRERTRLNVRDSDGTVIFAFGPLRGGTLATLEDCRELTRPHLVIEAGNMSVAAAANSLGNFVREHEVRTLNVAGPRAGEEPAIYDYVRAALKGFFAS